MGLQASNGLTLLLIAEVSIVLYLLWKWQPSSTSGANVDDSSQLTESDAAEPENLFLLPKSLRPILCRDSRKDLTPSARYV